MLGTRSAISGPCRELDSRAVRIRRQGSFHPVCIHKRFGRLASVAGRCGDGLPFLRQAALERFQIIYYLPPTIAAAGYFSGPKRPSVQARHGGSLHVMHCSPTGSDAAACAQSPPHGLLETRNVFGDTEGEARARYTRPRPRLQPTSQGRSFVSFPLARTCAHLPDCIESYPLGGTQAPTRCAYGTIPPEEVSSHLRSERSVSQERKRCRQFLGLPVGALFPVRRFLSTAKREKKRTERT